MSLLHSMYEYFRVSSLGGVSGGHTIISREEAEKLHLDDQWKDGQLPERQLAIVEKELARIRARNQFPAHMQALIDQVKLTGIPKPSLLEIGCSSGYGSEILNLGGVPVSYEGCDYSEAFLRLARQRYPHLPFQVCDATQLSYGDHAFDVVVSGCCLLHILDYPRAIAESVRVSKKFVIFHRTPVVHLRPTTVTRKKGYGIDMIELFFNEEELCSLFRANALEVLDILTFSQNAYVQGLGEPVWIKNYLCKRGNS